MKLARLRNLPFALVVVGFLVWLVALRPAALGGPATYLWVSGDSMEPTLASGDLAVIFRAPMYASGEIVAFRVPDGQPGAGGVVIHRIVGGTTAGGLVTRGDNRPWPDTWSPTQADLLGTLWFAVPGAATQFQLLRDPRVFAAAAASLTVVMVMVGGGSAGVASTRPVGPLGRLIARLAARLRGGRIARPSPMPNPYRWTLERGLVACRLAPPDGGGTPLDAWRQRFAGLPRGLVAVGPDRWARYRWTVVRGLAVCGLPLGRIPYRRPTPARSAVAPSDERQLATAGMPRARGLI